MNATTDADMVIAGSGPAGPAGRNNAVPKIVLVVVGVAALLAVMVIAFALPAVKSGPHNIPLGAVGTPQQAQLVQKAASGFTVELFIDEADAREAIMHRQIYGAVVFNNRDVTTLTATAASPTVAAIIPVLGQKIAAATGMPAKTVDLRNFPADDPKGIGLAAGAMPLALGGWIGAMVIMLLVATPRHRLIATAGVAVVGGVTLVATLQFVLGTFDGNFWLTSLAGILGIAATCCAVLGLREFFGGAGLGIAAVLLVFLGNPLSGLSSAPEMLPRPWGSIGQLLPPGATGALLRDVAFFDGHGAGHAVTALICWLLGGLGLYLAALRRNNRTEQIDVDEIHVGHQPMGDPSGRVSSPTAPLGDSVPTRLVAQHGRNVWALPTPSTMPIPDRPAPQLSPSLGERRWKETYFDTAYLRWREPTATGISSGPGGPTPPHTDHPHNHRPARPDRYPASPANTYPPGDTVRLNVAHSNPRFTTGAKVTSSDPPSPTARPHSDGKRPELRSDVRAARPEPPLPPRPGQNTAGSDSDGHR